MHIEEHQILNMIFSMQYFNDIFFFYLYGSLKKKAISIYPDNLKINREEFGESQVSSENNSQSQKEEQGEYLKSKFKDENLEVSEEESSNEELSNLMEK